MRVSRFLLPLQWMKGLRERSISAKPAAAIDNPPAKDKQRECERQIPPKGRQDQAHYNAQHREEQPEDFFIHLRRTLPRIRSPGSRSIAGIARDRATADRRGPERREKANH